MVVRIIKRSAGGGEPPKKGHCPECGQKIRKLNPHRMDKQKVTVLEIMAKAKLDGHEWVRPLEGGQIDIGGEKVRAPYRARAHASRLVWFGLAEHDHTVRSGKYRATDLGLKFLQGVHGVPSLIYCKDGKVVEKSDMIEGVWQVKHVVFDKAYWDNYAAIQK
jgi:hypothetical protein